MKYELLKRTAIALFVGSVISTYSVAEGSKISTKSSLEDIASAINKNDENISKIKTDVSDLAKSLKGDDQNPGLLDALEEANKGVNENKAALDKKADKEDVNKIKQNVSDLAKSLKGDDQNPGLLDSLEEANKGINENKEALALKADKATVDVELAKKANQADVETNKAEIAKFGAQTNSNAALLLTMAGKVDQNKKDTDEAIAKNASRITDTRNKQVLQNARLDNHSERITAAEVALDTKADKTELAAKADKTELANKADKNSVYSKSETDNKFALKADNSVVSAQAADINNLRTDVNAHKVDIDKLRTDVNVHTKRLDHLDNRVNKLDKDLKRGLAAQAALTGLFQPYTVGKANFTAAVGGYKSQTAVAIGTGYRYNQNIATKAGVAFTQGGGVTYNAGVNFEW